MAAWRYEFYLFVKIERTRERYFQHEKIKFVSLNSHVICSVYFIDTDEIPKEK